MDIQILETGGGGDISISGNDLVIVGGVENMPYLGTFGGDATYWANNLLFTESDAIKFLSETEALLKSVALTSGNRLLIEAAIKRDLQFLIDNVPNTTLNVQTQIQSDNVLLMNVDFGGINFSMLWNPKADAAKIVPYANPEPLILWATSINAYAIMEFTFVSGSTVVTFPAWVSYNSGDEDAYVIDLNSTFAPANGLTGTFAKVGSNFVYTQGASESWSIGTMPVKLPRVAYVGLTAPIPYGSTNTFTFRLEGTLSVLDWTDGSLPINIISGGIKSHVYADAILDRSLNIFHNDTDTTQISLDFAGDRYFVKNIVGRLPSSLINLVLSGQNLTSPALMPLNNLSLLELLTISSSTVTGFSPALLANMHNNIHSVFVQNNSLTSTEVDNIFIQLVANSPNATVYSSSLRQIRTDGQAPAAPPTAASATARGLLAAAGWTITTD